MSTETERRKQRTGVGSAMAAATSSMAGEKAERETEDFNEAVEFVVANTSVAYPGDLWEYTKDGTVLCKLVNHFQAGIVRKVNKPGMPFKEMENLTMYSSACKTLGCGNNTFRPPDLFEKRSSYPKAIIRNILALKKVMGKKGGSSKSPSRPTAAASTPAARPSSSPKKHYAYESNTPAAAPSNSTGSSSVSVNLSTFSNASPTRTTAHSAVADSGHGSGQTENDRRRAVASASSSVSGAPDWVKAAKSEQERNDMIAAQRWMEAVTNEPFTNGDLWETTKSGVYLCKMINKIKPGTVKKYSKMSTNLPFKCMENINFYIEGCQKLGMRPGNTFRSPDLFEKRVSYPKAIINNIHGLARIADDMKGYRGPKLTVEIASGNSL